MLQTVNHKLFYSVLWVLITACSNKLDKAPPHETPYLDRSSRNTPKMPTGVFVLQTANEVLLSFFQAITTCSFEETHTLCTFIVKPKTVGPLRLWHTPTSLFNLRENAMFSATELPLFHHFYTTAPLLPYVCLLLITLTSACLGLTSPSEKTLSHPLLPSLPLLREKPTVRGFLPTK